MGPPPVRVERIVDDALGCEIRSCERATGGRIAATYLLECHGEPERIVCKIGGPSIRTGEVIEPLVLRLIGASTDIPCPDVLAAGTVTDARNGRTRWALYEYCDGRTPTDFRALEPDVRDRIIRRTGAMLGELHATHQFERTGGLGRRDDTLHLRTPLGLHVPGRGRRLVGIHPEIDPDEWQAVFTHGDLYPGNVLVDEDGSIEVFLDWGNAHVTTAGYALARAEMRFVDWFRFPAEERKRHREALRRGYRQHRPIPPDYVSVATPYKVMWLGQSGDRIVRHLLTARGREQLRRHLRSIIGRREI